MTGGRKNALLHDFPYIEGFPLTLNARVCDDMRAVIASTEERTDMLLDRILVGLIVLVVFSYALYVFHEVTVG